MKYVDANVIIKAFTQNDDQRRCREVLEKPFVTTTLCLLEAYHGISRIKSDRIYAAYCIKSLYKTHAQIIDVDRNLLFESLRRIERYPLTIFDLVSYTVALIRNCTEFVSYDQDFNNLEIQRTEP